MKKTLGVLSAIILVGILLRLHNLTPFKIYPDSYLQLILMENIQKGSIIGTLGKYGMVYPDFIPWTRPLFPLLLLAIHPLLQNETSAAQTVSFLTGVLAIPLSFFLTSKLFKSKFVGLCSAFLLAVSFNHTVWGGFILTETTGVFMVLAFLLSLQYAVKKQSLLFDSLSGVLLASCILTRYEYSLLFLPVLIYLRTQSYAWSRILTIVAMAFLVIAIVIRWLFPLPYLFSTLKEQFSGHVVALGIPLLILLAGVYALKPYQKKIIHSRTLSLILQTLFSGLVGLVTFNYFFPFLTHFSIELSGMTDFFGSEPLLLLTLILGVLLVLRQRKHLSLLSFATLSTLLLFLAYYRANPYAQRYWTHLLPFLLIPASYGLSQLLRIAAKPNYVIKGCIGFILISITLWQLVLSYQGMTNWKGGEYRHISYEEQAGLAVHKRLTASPLLLTAFPESYYLTTKLSTFSLTDTPPFIYIPPNLANHQLVIVQDMGMRDLFPTFSALLDRHLADKKIASFAVHTPYQYADRLLPEKYLISLYQVSVAQLQAVIKQAATLPKPN